MEFSTNQLKAKILFLLFDKFPNILQIKEKYPILSIKNYYITREWGENIEEQLNIIDQDLIL